MGAAQRKGDTPHFFGYIAGEKVEQDLFENIDTSWQRVAGGEEVSRLLRRARDEYRVEKPDAILPLLSRRTPR